VPGVDYDFDGDPRPFGPAPDIGFDEVTEDAVVNIVRVDCESVDPASCPLQDIFPSICTNAPVILPDLAFPGEAVDPLSGILSNTNLPLVFYPLCPEGVGNSLFLVKDHDTDSVRLVFGH
jgi:hypothetical protein